jgi:hypothetical protein
MKSDQDISIVAAEFRQHFDQYYIGVIPRLLNEEGVFLAFVSMLTALDSLSGAYAPNLGTGERFRKFITEYFPEYYAPVLEKLWQFRNRMVHSFNPDPFLIVCHKSRMHLAYADSTPMLNGEDFYADMVAASRLYFTALYSTPELQKNFAKSVAESAGGRIQTRIIEEKII